MGAALRAGVVVSAVVSTALWLAVSSSAAIAIHTLAKVAFSDEAVASISRGVVVATSVWALAVTVALAIRVPVRLTLWVFLGVFIWTSVCLGIAAVYDSRLVANPWAGATLLAVELLGAWWVVRLLCGNVEFAPAGGALWPALAVGLALAAMSKVAWFAMLPGLSVR